MVAALALSSLAATGCGDQTSAAGAAAPQPTTAAPLTVAPTTAAPLPVAPTTAAPLPVAPMPVAPTTVVPTTTTAPAAVAVAGSIEASGPPRLFVPRVLFVGDSVMGQVAAPAAAALRSAGGDGEFVLSVGVTRVDLGFQAAWRELVGSRAPDAVVVLVSTWDAADQVIDGVSRRPDDAAFGLWYRTRFEAWVRALAGPAGDVPVVVVAMPPNDDADREQRRRAIEAHQRVATVSAGATFVDASSPIVAGGRFAEVVDGVRVRMTDGLHLCPTGATRMASAVLDAVGRRLGPVGYGTLEPPYGWWLSTDRFPDYQCPPV